MKIARLTFDALATVGIIILMGVVCLLFGNWNPNGKGDL